MFFCLPNHVFQLAHFIGEIAYASQLLFTKLLNLCHPAALLLRSGRRDWKLNHPVFSTVHHPRCLLLEDFHHFTLESPFLTHNSIAVFVLRFSFD